jgi:serine/threonine-protein kinase HipA
MAESIGVWLGERHVGALTLTTRGATFAFNDAVVASSPREPLLSTSLPVQSARFDSERTLNWFIGLLPEDRRREEVSRRFNLQSGSYFDMLREIGWECAGAVIIAPENQSPHRGLLRPLTDADLGERLTALPAHPYDDDDSLRISLGGYQAKMLATRTVDGWFLPTGGAISTHILKPQPALQWPGLIQGEAWAMTAAASATSTADIELLEFDGSPQTLVVTRFDREVVDGTLVRLHQEDAAQAMGIHPDRKYAGRQPSKSDPSLLKIARILERYATDPAAERQRLLQQVVVNVAVGNTDAHAKNYGLLHPSDQTVALSPMYDVVPATVVNPATADMGMRVGDALVIDRVTPQKIIDEAVSWGMRDRDAAATIEAALLALREGAHSASERFPNTPVAIPQTVQGTIERLLNELATHD